MMNMDMLSVAKIAGVPHKNMMAWIGGKRAALRLRSIVAILQILGVRIEQGRTGLDSERVHFWDIRLPWFGNSKAAYAPLTAVSRLLAGGAITEVRPHAKAWTLRERLRRRYFMVYGTNSLQQPVMVVICVHKSPFRKAMVSPDILKGSLWRDDNDHHCLTVREDAWTNITNHDMTTHEYVRAFESVKIRYTWSDVSLMAREFGETPEDVAEWMLRSHAESNSNITNSSEEGIQFLLGRVQDAA
jgi:hypothetical protein